MKDCLIIGNGASLSYKDTYELLRTKTLMVTERAVDFYGDTHVCCSWLSTMRWVPDNRIKLTRTYTPEDYPRYDNYDAIEVNNKKDIPADYEGKMGVPITFFYWYPDLDYDILEKRGDLKLNGKQLFQRLIIQKRQGNNNS